MRDEEFLQVIFQHIYPEQNDSETHAHTLTHTLIQTLKTHKRGSNWKASTQNNQRRLVPPNPEAPRVPVEPEW